MLGLAEPPEPVKVWTGLRAVPCPDCPATVGEWCVSRNDKRFNNGHANRHKLAGTKQVDEGGNS